MFSYFFQTLIEANVDVKTTDGYLLRVFCIGFTNKDQMSQRKTCYAQHTQVWLSKGTNFYVGTLHL
jgi:ribosomal protein S3AE